MDFMWKSGFGKLFAGGCGTQVGLLLSCAGLTAVLSLCVVCAFSNALSTRLTYEFAKLSPGGVEQNASEANETPLLDALMQEIDALGVNPSALSLGLIPPAEPVKPMVTAAMSGVNLRSGPGLQYRRIGLLPKGESLEVVGRNSDSTWFLVTSPSGHAWLFSGVVSASNIDDRIPMVTIPALLTQPNALGQNSAPANTLNAVRATATPAPVTALSAPLPGTPTAAASAPRLFVRNTVGYKRLAEQLGAPPVSESFSPRGDQIAIMEGIKLHTVATDGLSGLAWLDSDGTQTISGGAVWSPDGRYIAFIVDYKGGGACRPCRAVGILRLEDRSVLYLQTPDDLDGDAPRWTQDGRLLINVHPSNPAGGTVYVYTVAGQGRKATGVYVLSSSHVGQRWSPWLPGKVWQVGVTERPDTYYD